MEANREATRAAWLAALREAEVFRVLADPELERLLASAEERHYRAGEVLVRRGERYSGVHILLRGQARVLVEVNDVHWPVRLAQEGETLPLAVLLDPPIAIAIVEAFTELETLFIPRRAVVALCEAETAAAAALYRAVAAVFRHRYERALIQMGDLMLPRLQSGVAPTKGPTDRA